MYSDLVGWAIYALPLLMVIVMCGSLAVYEIRNFRVGGVSPFLMLLLATFGLLAILLNERNRLEGGFVVPVVMSLLLMGFFWFLAFRKELVR